MSTAMEKKATKGDKAAAIAAYRQAVLDFVDQGMTGPADAAICEAARRYPADFALDCGTYSRRLQAVKDIARAVELEREAASIPPDTNGGELPVSAFKTIGELHRALFKFGHLGQPNYIGPNRGRRHDLQTEASLLRGQAQRLLDATANLELRAQIVALGAERTNLDSSIATQERLLVASRRREKDLQKQIQSFAGRDNSVTRAARKAAEVELQRQATASERIAGRLATERREQGTKSAKLAQEEARLREQLRKPEIFNWV